MQKIPTIAAAVILSVIVAYGTVKMVAVPGVAVLQKESTYDRVMRTGTIRCGYVLYPPAVVKNVNTGKLSGFAYDIMNRMAHDLGLKIEWAEETNPGIMLEGLQANRYDMVCTPFWRNAERARVADFTDPFYYSAMGIWARADDHRFDEDIRAIDNPDVTLSILDGTTLIVVADQDFPKAKRLGLPQGAPLSDLMLNVAMKKADILTIDNYLAVDYVANNPGSLRNITPDKPIRIYPNGFIINKNDYAFKSMLDASLVELLYSGYIDKTIDQYEKYPGTFYRYAPPFKRPQ